MGDSIGILRLLPVLISGSQTMSKAITQLRDTKKWTREDNKHVVQYYFNGSPTQREYGKRMIEIWVESA